MRYGTDRPGFSPAWAVVALATIVPAAAGGCKMGTAGTKPSWWSFGGAPGSEAEKLAAAPSFSGGIEKPSATNNPYPTTNTPNSYVLDDATKAGAPALAAAPAAVTYGATPPPTRPDPVSLATGPAAGATPGAVSTPPLSAITPQVGPYAGLPSEPPAVSAANAELPPLQSVADGAAPAAAGFAAPAAASTPPQRVADARGATGWPDAPAVGGRYAGATSSAFGSGAALDQPQSPPSAAALPTPLDPLPPAAAPAAAPSGFAPPAALPAPAAAPAATSPGGPLRRPDRNYRPGGTSSYRPSKAILAGDGPAADPGSVQPVGFETPAGQAP